MTAFMQIFLASPGFSSVQLLRASPIAALTRPSTSPLSNLPLVWPSNWGSGILTLMTATRPSRQSSPEGEGPLPLRTPLALA